MTEWSPKQERCLRQALHWALDPHADPIFLLTGDAGTGKTTLAIEVQRRLEEQSKRVGAYAYTGKAASVLRNKGFANAKTFHSDLYIPATQSRKRLGEYESAFTVVDKELVECADEARQKVLRAELKTLKEKIKAEHEALANPMFVLNTESCIKDLDVLIADEVSMVGSRLGTDLERVCGEGGVKMLLMGDPNQLPPVRDTAHFMDRKPDFHLDEIHRQARDNPILHIAHKLKNREHVALGSYGDSRVTRDLPAQEALACDQMLVGRNKTREYYNRRLREERGYENLVEIGEKLICLANSKEGYFNGSIWYVEDDLGYTSDKQRICLNLRSEDSNVPSRQALVHCKSLRGEIVHYMDAQGAQCMVSAQAVTVHKFQGSEAEHVVLLDESGSFGADSHRWLYTGATRAKTRLTLVLD